MWWFIRTMMWVADRDRDDIEWARAMVHARDARRRLFPQGYDIVKAFDEGLRTKHKGRNTLVSYPEAIYRIDECCVTRAWSLAFMKAEDNARLTPFIMSEVL